MAKRSKFGKGFKNKRLLFLLLVLLVVVIYAVYYFMFSANYSADTIYGVDKAACPKNSTCIKNLEPRVVSNGKFKIQLMDSSKNYQQSPSKKW